MSQQSHLSQSVTLCHGFVTESAFFVTTCHSILGAIALSVWN